MARKTVTTKDEYRTEVYGSVVRKVRVEVPQRPEKVDGPKEVPAKKYKTPGDKLSRGFTIFVVAASLVFLFACSMVLEQRALNIKNQKTIASLENDLTELKKENADTLNRIESSINLEEIREIAINELGMVYATEENVVLYKNTSQNYVSQYEQVPEEGATIMDSIMNLK